jgi:class 3 adenylate cyclase
LVDPKITEHRGRIVKTTGDGMLVEFVSVVDTVRCAVDIQRGMAERNAGVLAENRIEFRIGINVGDIISDDNDIYGDGVNVAARLQAVVVNRRTLKLHAGSQVVAQIATAPRLVANLACRSERKAAP